MTERCPHCDHPTRHDRTYSDRWSWVFTCRSCCLTWTTSTEPSTTRPT